MRRVYSGVVSALPVIRFSRTECCTRSETTSTSPRRAWPRGVGAVGRDAPSRVPETAIVAFITLFAALDASRDARAGGARARRAHRGGTRGGRSRRAWSPAPDARPGVDASATLGLLSLPWTFAARTPDGMTPRDAFALWTCVTAGALTLARDVAPRRVVPGVSRASMAVLAALVCAARRLDAAHGNRRGFALTAHAALGACVLAHALPAVALAPPSLPCSRA